MGGPEKPAAAPKGPMYKVMVSRYFGDAPKVHGNGLTKEEADKLCAERQASVDGCAYSVERDN